MIKKTKENSENAIQRTTVEVVNDFFNVGKVKRLFRVGSDVFGAVMPFIEKPTIWSGAKAAFAVGKIVVDDVEIWPDAFFDEGWEQLYTSDFTTLIVAALAGKPYKVLRTSDESWVINIVFVGDVKFGYTVNVKTGNVDVVNVESDKLERAKGIIKEEIWRFMKKKNIVLRQEKRRSVDAYESSTIAIDGDDNIVAMRSQRSDEYSKYLKKCIDAGVPRSVMLYGPPGTGKSTMARAIVEDLGMRSFRIRVNDIGHLNQNTLFDAISMFEPDAVILDDFDRSDSQSTILESLEFFQKHVKLVLATVNKKSRLDPAILRPGRFDELLHVKRLDDDVIKLVLGEGNLEHFDVVKNWPIAFVNEYVKRLRFMTPEDAALSVKELAKRVKNITDEDEDEEEGSVENILGSKSGAGDQDLED